MIDEAGDSVMSDLHTHPGHLLRRAHQIAASIFHDELGAYVTPVQYAILHTLANHPGIDQVTLAGLVAIDTSTAASVAIRLEEKKLLVRHIDAKNRRQRALYVTDAGRALLQQTIPAICRLKERVLDGFTVEEQDQFLSLLSKLVQNNNLKSRAPFQKRHVADSTQASPPKPEP